MHVVLLSLLSISGAVKIKNVKHVSEREALLQTTVIHILSESNNREISWSKCELNKPMRMGGMTELV